MSEYLLQTLFVILKNHWRRKADSYVNRADRISMLLVTLTGGNFTCSVYLFTDGFF